ncbi:MAG: hypothetical protein JWM69_1220 [Candidatus Binatus sp.]|nr:hypothetical protein [Candidatus Binatus sp.]
MKVAGLMTKDVKTCGTGASLNKAAQIMWENDCGCVPIVAEDARVVGIVTDRDICMAAYTQGQPLASISITLAMSHRVITCFPNDDLETAHRLLRTHEIHRVTVVDDSGAITGILSLSDITHHVHSRDASASQNGSQAQEIVRTVFAIRRRRGAAETNGSSNGHTLPQSESLPTPRKSSSRRRKSPPNPG